MGKCMKKHTGGEDRVWKGSADYRASKQARVADDDDDNELVDINRYGISDDLEDVVLKDALRSWTEGDYKNMWDVDGCEGTWTTIDEQNNTT